MNGRQVQAVEEARFGGVDWSWERHAVCIVDAAGAVIERFEAEHPAAGLQAMVRRLRRAGALRVAIERGDGPVVDALLAGGLQVVVISSRQVQALRLRYGTAGNKDDRFDAFVLADVLRSDGHRFASLTPDSSATIGLRALVRARKDLVKHRIALGNQLRANLLAAFPGAVGLFAEIDSPISLTFLTRFPSAERAGWLSEQTDGRLAGRGRLLRPADPRAADGPPARRPGRADRTGRRRLRHRDRATRRQPGRSAGPHRRPRRGHRRDPRPAPRRRGLHQPAPAGTNRAALLLAEIGDCRARFPDDTALAAAAGVAPSTRASGKRHHVAFRHSCDKKLREALIDFAADSRQASPWAADLYQRARDRGARHPHAVRILARAWCRIIWRCWTDGTAYDPGRHGGLQQQS